MLTFADHHAFLRALDDNDGDKLEGLAPPLYGSFLKMPASACANVGLPAGSTYAAAVRAMFPDYCPQPARDVRG